ncbi:MAG: hypothetical protein ACYCWL_00145 [Thauera sp.]
MRLKTESAAVVVLSAIGIALAVGTLAGLALARITGHNGTPAAHQAPAPRPERCPCVPQTITT